MLFSTVRHQAWEPACFLSDHFRSEVWAVGQPGPRTSGTDFDFLLLTSQLHGGLLTFPHMATMLLPLRPETPLEPSSFPVIWLGPVPRPPHYAEASTLLPSHTDRQVPDPPASSLSTHSPWEVPVNVYLCEAPWWWGGWGLPVPQSSPYSGHRVGVQFNQCWISFM